MLTKFSIIVRLPPAYLLSGFTNGKNDTVKFKYGAAPVWFLM